MENRRIALNECREMNRMGHTYWTWFVNPFGIPFHKDFATGDEMKKFIDKAREVGSQFLGFISI